MREIIMAYQGQMALKGLNKYTFDAELMKIMRYRLQPHGN